MKKYDVYKNGELIIKQKSLTEISKKINYSVNYLYKVINNYGGKVKDIELEYKSGQFDKEEFCFLWDTETKKVKDGLKNKQKETKDIITSSARAYR